MNTYWLPCLSLLCSMDLVPCYQPPKHLPACPKSEMSMISIGASQASRSSVKVKEINSCTGEYMLCGAVILWIEAQVRFSSLNQYLHHLLPQPINSFTLHALALFILSLNAEDISEFKSAVVLSPDAFTLADCLSHLLCTACFGA